MEKIKQIEKYIIGCRDFAVKKQLATIKEPKKLDIKTDVEFYAVEERIYSEVLDEIQKIKNS